MKKLQQRQGFTLVEVLISTAVFALFAAGIYGALQMVLKVVYKSRVSIIETALIDERLEIARNLPFDKVGIIGGLPVGLIPHTTTTVRNGITFLVTTYIRNIDDPYDGVLGGVPNDTAPGDYKLVEINVRCTSCEFPTEATVNTIIPPRDLEGSTLNGAIFVHVSDSNSNPVAGANVHVVNTSTVPNIIIDDITDKDGYLRIVDTPTGTRSYSITVEKPGYSVDATTPSSTANPNPTRLPITVSAQQISETYFSIDKLSSMGIHAVDESCDAVSGASFTMRGDKMIGDNLRKYEKNLTADSGGNIDLQNLEFDTYNFLIGGGYDLAGSIPMAPLELKGGAHKDITLIFSPHIANSLLVSVVDNGNGQPLSDATIKISRAGYSSTQKTTYGNMSQTEWSGGSGYVIFSNEAPSSTGYAASNNVDTFSPNSGLGENVVLMKFSDEYYTEGWLESSVFDIGKKVDLKNVEFTSSLWPVETGENAIQLQLAMSNSSSPATLTNFIGPDGTDTSYYSSITTTIYTGGNKYQFFKYKLYLKTASTTFSPAVSDIAVTFTNGCVPPGQVYFRGITPATYTLEVSAPTYDTSTIPVDVSGQATSTVRLHKSA